MSEGIGTPAEGPAKSAEAGGMPAQAVPAQKKFFMIEYWEEARRGFKWLRAAPKAEEGVVKKASVGLRKWSKLRKARVGMGMVIVIVLLSYGLFSAQAGSTRVVTGGPPHGPGETGHNQTLNFTGTVQEKGTTAVNATLNVTRFTSLVITLTWKDEPAGALRTNQPDQLGFAVKAPDGENWTVPMASNPQGGQGQVTWKLNDTAKDYGSGAWMITVEGGTMGDTVKTTGNPVCLVGCSADTSNTWSLSVDAAW